MEKLNKMKKLLFLLTALTCLFSISSTAQTILPVKKYIYEYKGVASDTVGVVDTVWNKAIQLNKLDGLFYNAAVKVSDATAGATCKIKLQGKVFATDTYTDITELKWTGTGTDTTFVFTGNTNKIYYRYLNFLVTGTANKTKIDYVKLSLKK